MAFELYTLLPPSYCTCVVLTGALQKRTSGSKSEVLLSNDTFVSLHRIHIRHSPLFEVHLLQRVGVFVKRVLRVWAEER
jgi:hypothetical protein